MHFARLLLPAKREWRVSYPPSSRATLISHAVVVGMASASGSAKRVCALRLAGLSRICQDARQDRVQSFKTSARRSSPARVPLRLSIKLHSPLVRHAQQHGAGRRQDVGKAEQALVNE